MIVFTQIPAEKNLILRRRLKKGSLNSANWNEQEATMCRSVRVRLTPSERATVNKWSGVMIPLYASIALFILGFLFVAHSPWSPEPIAVASAIDRR
jgi:hypothetical protein